jgi:hypothetical protein
MTDVGGGVSRIRPDGDFDEAAAMMATRKSREELIETVDVWGLSHFHWPFMRALCRRYVELRELRYYQHRLLRSHRWNLVRCVPHRDEGGIVSTHIFDVYGMPA